jgi:tripeptidyl-peptidase-1
MDIQYSVAMVYPDPVIYYAVIGTIKSSSTDEPGPSDLDTLDPYLEWIFSLTRLQNTMIPLTISVGWHFDEQTIPEDYAHTFCDLFAELGVRGITVFAASGDEGVGAPEKCRDSSGNVRFYTTFPASCTCGV